MTKEDILSELKEIVGKDFASNKKEDLFIYSFDPGASLPREVDYVVMPNSVEEVQKIVKLANKERIPVVPMGGGLTLSGLVIPVKGGIVLDMKRMDRVIEINEYSKYAVIESGVTTGQLLAYLNDNYPDLQPPVPDAPAAATVAGNVLIHGSSYLSQKYGNHSFMINGLEVVLPNGDICKLGSASVSKYWFTRGPIPDLIGLFTSSFGTLGIVTKLSVKLFYKPKFRDVVFGLATDFNDLPNILLKVTESGLAEDVILGMQDKPDWMKGYIFVIVYVTGESQDEIDVNTKGLKKIYRKTNARYMKTPPKIREIYMEKPIFSATAADFRKGGGFEYVGAFIPLENIPEAYRGGIEISKKYGIVPTLGSRLIGQTHTVMVFFTYPFNRADPEDVKNARDALHETNMLALKLGGIPWKAEIAGQKLILEKMDPNYKKLFKTIRDTLDPNHIMNPGNWEVE